MERWIHHLIPAKASLCIRDRHMDNFAALADAFVQDGAARVVRAPEDLAAMFAFADDADSAESGRRARRMLESLSGATEKTLAAVDRCLIDAGKKE